MRVCVVSGVFGDQILGTCSRSTPPPATPLEDKARDDPPPPRSTRRRRSSTTASSIRPGLHRGSSGPRSSRTTRAARSRGSMTAVAAATGPILWKTTMAPPRATAAAACGGTPALDPDTNSSTSTTGNNYTSRDTVNAVPGRRRHGRRVPRSERPHRRDHGAEHGHRRDQVVDRRTGLRRLERRLHPGFASELPARQRRARLRLRLGAEPVHDQGATAARTGSSSAPGQKSGQYWALDAATGRSSGAPPPARAPRSAASSGARRPTASGSTSPRRTSTGIPYPFRRRRRSRRARGRRSTRRPGKILWQVPTRRTTRSAAATRSARCRSRTASSTRRSMSGVTVRARREQRQDALAVQG